MYNNAMEVKMTKETITAEQICTYLANKMGDDFRIQRENMDISLRDIYRDEKISAGVVTDFEKGRKFPRVENIIKLYQYINMPLDEVFNPKILPPTIKNKRMKLCGDIDLNLDLKELLMSKGYNGKEIDDIIQYAEFVKHKRS